MQEIPESECNWFSEALDITEVYVGKICLSFIVLFMSTFSPPGEFHLLATWPGFKMFQLPTVILIISFQHLILSLIYFPFISSYLILFY